MNIFKEGYIKYFFELGEDYDPFLLNISQQDDNENKIKDNFFHHIPLSSEMREKINQCIYMIYQELIRYKGNTIQDYGKRNISPIKKFNYNDIEIKIFKRNNEILTNKDKKNLKNSLWRNDKVSSCRTFKYSNIKLDGNKNENNKNYKYEKELKSNLNKNDMNININNYNIEENDLNDKNQIIYDSNSNEDINNNEKNQIDINKGNNNYFPNERLKEYLNNNINKNFEKETNQDELKLINKNSQEFISNRKNKNSINIINNTENLNKVKSDPSNNNIIKKENYKELYKNDRKNFENTNKKENRKNTNTVKNKSNTNIIPMKSRNLKIIIFNDNIINFSKDFYPYYFTSIPKEIKDMFKIEKKIIKNMTQGISPYLLIIYEKIPSSKEIDDSNWINIKNYILGICSFSFEFNFNYIKLNINHISISISNDDKKIDETNLENINYIFNKLIVYIKNNFYFDEIVIEYNPSKVNQKILNFFLNDLNFIINNEDENENEEMKEQNIKEFNNKREQKNEIYNKMIYTNHSNKNEVCNLIQESTKRYINKNIFDIFDSIVITGNSELESLQKDNKDESYLFNDVIKKYLLDKKEKINMNGVYKKITNLDQLIKVFQNNNINKNEIPLSLAENRFDIISSLLDKATFNNCFNNSIFFNNYNQNDPGSYFDKNTRFYYNFIKSDKIIILENLKYNIKIYHILSNKIGLFFCKVTDEFEKYLNNNDNIYSKLNDVYKETLQINKIDILNDEIIWIPCFEINKHLKTFSSNGFGSFHEYIKIYNKVIEQVNSEPFLVKSKNHKKNNQYKIIPDLINDIFLDNDFIFGIVDNIEILSENNSEEKIEINNINNDGPNIIFSCYIKKSNFIIRNT